ncbi:stage II sporulation protein M [Nocardioides stalactiti]|uniref:stage II sporulation protein M n=1 Tax=Nocardioides stalactiti TaxID=2755356 RepID=UPI0028A9AC0F|nr:stage II sporulation protein M [Nocardioides stalactiti]
MPRIDLDAYVTAHAHEWLRLEELVKIRRPTGPESDELVDRYQRVATHLSVVRTSAPDAEVVSYLSSLLGRARIAMLGARVLSWRAVGRFFTEQFPAALYRLRWWWLGCVAANVVVTALLMWWLVDHPEVEQTLLSPGEVDDLVNNDFESYYSENAASAFATRVWVNNAWVAALCIALGILGLPVLYLLFQNILNVAVIGSIMTRHDRADLFWGLILPHGLLELTAVFVAGGVGLRLFWSWVEPGGTSRAASLAQAGRTAITCALGLVAVLFVSGIIEAFVTPSPLPTWARITIGVLAEIAFLLYVFVLGRQAAAAGHTGDINADLLEDRVATQA